MYLYSYTDVIFLSPYTLGGKELRTWTQLLKISVKIKKKKEMLCLREQFYSSGMKARSEDWY